MISPKGTQTFENGRKIICCDVLSFHNLDMMVRCFNYRFLKDLDLISPGTSVSNISVFLNIQHSMLYSRSNRVSICEQLSNDMRSYETSSSSDLRDKIE